MNLYLSGINFMDYKPLTAVWEITMGCNMRCGHCGSSCHEPLQDELTTEEAFAVIDQMKTLGLQWITLSGGEPLTRKDWPLLAGHLTRSGIIPNIITNGWLLTEEMVRTAQANGVQTISISLDGTRETHDMIRKKGSFDRVIEAFRILRRCNNVSAANTTVTNLNIGELDAIKEVLIENKVDLWQIQIGLPMGNLAQKKDLVVSPDVVERLIDYSYATMLEGRIRMFPADCLGYYTAKESIVRQSSTGVSVPVIWQGCNAGKRSFGLLHNGDITGCTSIRDKEFIEGNIRTRSLVDIWNDPDSFKWAREMKKTQLKGNCEECSYGSSCLGGCPNTRLTLNGDINSENVYCVYNQSMAETRATLAKLVDPKELLESAEAFCKEGKWQLASLTVQRLLQISPDNIDALSLYGFASFHLENYETAKNANLEILKQVPDHGYAMTGLGITLHKMGYAREGIDYLTRVAESDKPERDMARYDLAVVTAEKN
jgi:radical SAM protein with 4Fe4S-binding SPASM domain